MRTKMGRIHPGSDLSRQIKEIREILGDAANSPVADSRQRSPAVRDPADVLQAARLPDLHCALAGHAIIARNQRGTVPDEVSGLATDFPSLEHEICAAIRDDVLHKSPSASFLRLTRESMKRQGKIEIHTRHSSEGGNMAKMVIPHKSESGHIDISERIRFFIEYGPEQFLTREKN
jgi:hypothetical protein